MMFNEQQRFLLILFPVIRAATTSTTTDQATCYLPNKSIDTKAFPCNTTALANGKASACCLPNDACYESGACFQDWSGVMYRQGCTDPTFRDPACPKMCLEDGMLNDGIWIPTCVMGAGKACCLGSGMTNCCNDTKNLFDFKPGWIQAVLDPDGINRLPPIKQADVASPSTSTTPSPESTPPSSQTSSLSSESSRASPDIEVQRGPSFSSAAIAIVAVLACLLALSTTALGFLWIRHNNERKKMAALEQNYAIGQQTISNYAAQLQQSYYNEKPLPNNPIVAVEMPGTEISQELPCRSEKLK
ncbi:hypothetical protein F5Y04DRAFT_264530 [Hypomontagnella monticulosa]|nr:hypothetical protein F5Y04DRAFT_264530 [Hypomontagnella monticulosa]